jgi:hypothetical protein
LRVRWRAAHDVRMNLVAQRKSNLRFCVRQQANVSI